MSDTLTGQTVTVDGWRGIAWYVDGPEMVDEWDDGENVTEWSGVQIPTGMLECHMVGDDRTFRFDPDDLTIIPEDDYCHECGQIGCTADGR